VVAPLENRSAQRLRSSLECAICEHFPVNSAASHDTVYVNEL
jgi:hypothetical protein